MDMTTSGATTRDDRAPRVRRFTASEVRRMAEAGLLATPDGDGATPPLRFDVEAYHALGRAGILAPDERTELIDGIVYAMAALGSRHAACVNDLAERLIVRAGGRYKVCVQSPIRLSDGREPEPDVMLVRRATYYEAHPTPADAFLVVEVADTSLAFDRAKKLPMYAAHAIPEVWIVNLADDVVETYHDPGGEAFRAEARYARGDTVAPLRVPDLALGVGDVLGPPSSSE